MSRDLDQLAAITAMILDAELLRLNRLSSDIAERKAALTALASAQQERASALQDGVAGDDLAFLTGRDAAWTGWMVATGREMSRQLAETAARREEQRLRAQIAFGKHDALCQMQARAAAERRQSRQRRGEG